MLILCASVWFVLMACSAWKTGRVHLIWVVPAFFAFYAAVQFMISLHAWTAVQSAKSAPDFVYAFADSGCAVLIFILTLAGSLTFLFIHREWIRLK